MAARFWVGGTGTWDASDTTHWASSSGGAGGASVPTSADSVTFDGSSGGGTVTVAATLASSNTVLTLACGAFTGTLDFSINNPSMSMLTFSVSGSGTRTVKMGSGTFTLTSTTTVWDATTTTNLTFQAGTSTIALTNSNPNNIRTIAGGGLTYNNITINAAASSVMDTRITGVNTISNLTVSAPNQVWINAAQTITTLNLNGTSLSSMVLYWTFEASSATNTQTVTSATINYALIGGLAWSGSPVANNSFDLGKNSGITINSPSSGVGVIGG